LVGSICDEAERLERLVANLLEMTRLESGTLSLKRDWIPVEELVRSALTRLEAKLAQHAIQIDIPDSIPLIYVDPVVFELIFVNLFENTCKYTPTGTRIEVHAARSADSILIEVCDNGPGVPKGFEEKLFEKFYRGPHSGTSGAGLGLPICRGIAEAHGGSIRAEQAPSGGLAFYINVPIGGTPPTLATEATDGRTSV
jgi:two-component system sensor histidine kinase KdpD